MRLALGGVYLVTSAQKSCSRFSHLHGRAGGHQEEHRLAATGDLAVIKVDADHRVGAQLRGLTAELIQTGDTSVTQGVLRGLVAATEEVTEAGEHVLEDVHPEHALCGDDVDVLGDTVALEVRGGGEDHTIRHGGTPSGCHGIG